MDSDRIRRFFHHSREWARATRGLDLFHRAAHDLALSADIDSGFFVYRRRVFTDGVTPQQAQIYAPWGRFQGHEDQLQRLVDDVASRPSVMDPIQERWGPLDAVSGKLKDKWLEYGIHSFGIWPLVSREQRIGVLAVARTTAISDVSDATTTALLDACAAQVSVALDLILATRLAEDASQRDWLTGLWNRRGLEARWEGMTGATKESGKPLLISVIDLDHLKIINDTQGHPAGDAALRRVAQILTQEVRSQDLVVRWGGDEFIVVTVSSAADPGVLHRLQEAVRTKAPGLSVSIGSAVWGQDGITWDQCYTVADQRLYEAKRRRRGAHPISESLG